MNRKPRKSFEVDQPIAYQRSRARSQRALPSAASASGHHFLSIGWPRCPASTTIRRQLRSQLDPEAVIAIALIQQCDMSL